MIRSSTLAVALFFCTLVTQSFTVAKADTTEAALWEALRSNSHFAMIRHALAPGTGDPEEFVIGRRDTQRNLSEKGRQQAKHIGDLFRANGIEMADVYSSEWFRCSDTAELLDLGEAKALPTLNSFFRNYTLEEPQTNGLKTWLTTQLETDKPLVLVTHQVNITALTGVYPSSGEIVVVKRDTGAGIKVLGSIETD